MIRIAFAGFRHPHILMLYQAARESGEVEIVGAFEEDEEIREKMERECGVSFTYGSYAQLLADPAVDAVAVGDYYAVRGARIVGALKSGKHVISDKPLCTSLAEHGQIEALAENKGLCVYAMLDLRFDVRLRAAKRIVEEGRLGKLGQISFGGRHPLLYGERPAWYFEEGKYGGVLNDIAVHGLDIVSYICDQQPSRILFASCRNLFAAEVPHFKDSGVFACELSGGATLMADVSYSSPNGMRYAMPSYWEFDIFGTEGALRFGRNLPSLTLYKKDSDTPEKILPEPASKTMIEDFLDHIQKKSETVLSTKESLLATKWALKLQAYADAAASGEASF